METKEDIFQKIKNILVNDFEIEDGKITHSAKLFDDLELDSIDAVDLAVKVQQFTGKKIPPENFKKIITIDDVVDTICELL